MLTAYVAIAHSQLSMDDSCARGAVVHAGVNEGIDVVISYVAMWLAQAA